MNVVEIYREKENCNKCMFDVEDKRISTLSSPSRNCNSESIQKTEKVVQ